MQVSKLIYSWPREARYSCNPDDYEGDAIEDYEIEITPHAPQLGDIRMYGGQCWYVVRLNAYLGDKDEQRFAIVQLSLDKTLPLRDPWDGGVPQVMYILITPDDISYGFPETPEDSPKIGDEPHHLPGWQVNTIHQFQSQDPQGDEIPKVLVCWCAAMQQTGQVFAA